MSFSAVFHLSGHWRQIIALLVVVPIAGLCCGNSSAQQSTLRAVQSEDGNEIRILRGGSESAIVTQVAQPGTRPYLHPIAAPTGNGLMTEFSPDHHRHQTGLYWGFTRVNGRDYFHNIDEKYWKRASVNILKASAASAEDTVQWQTVYDLLDADGKTLLKQSQIWTLRDDGKRYFLDLQWTGSAEQDVTVGKYDYGGLFLRMPWNSQLGGQVVNSSRQRGERAEGERAVWVDVGVNVPDRTDKLHIAIFDHPINAGYPQPWRVDGQLGVGPVRARTGDWQIRKGSQEVIRHRLVAYTGELPDTEITNLWSDYSGQSDSVMWGLAQQQGRQAKLLNPQEALQTMTLQDGVQGNVYASEPMMTQPMAFCWDAKGRIWIAENRDYETRQTGFSADGTSRILILEDTDHDGVADSKKVFLEGIPFPSAIAVGMGGLWLGAPPNLLFVPDRNQDDKADMDQIEVRLTGWGIADRHETLNSFHWGPDGWLYGLQGFATPSKVGQPKGAGKLYKHKDPFPTNIEFDGQPVDINGGVWRYHPTKQRFEVVAHGFSNPWGVDYDQYGQLFITACVIPHLWHVIPGGIYHRQGGSHFNPYVYNDIKTIAEHRHRSAHGGARVYQSDAFDAKYQGRVFMANIHEHAVLTDIITPKGSGYVGQHGDDFALANNAQWIGFSIEVGPEGAIYALDWHDADICGKEVLNKDTGRIFRFTPKNPASKPFPHRYDDLNTLSDVQLAELQLAPSVWHATFARVILQHRSQSQTLNAECLKLIQGYLTDGSRSTAIRLRALWTLHATSALDSQQLTSLLSDSDQYLRAWAIQLLCEDFKAPTLAVEKMIAMAAKDSSAVVRLYLASAAQRIDAESRWKIVELLSKRGEDEQDHNIPKMIWFALEPLVMNDPSRAISLAGSAKLSLVARQTARRLCDGDRIEQLGSQISNITGNAQLNILLGMRDATEGRFDMTSPKGWSEVAAKIESSGGEAAAVAKQLSQQFGDTVAASHMLATLRNKQSAVEERRQALQQLAGRKRAELKTELEKLLQEDGLRREAIRAMANYDDVRFAKALLAEYNKLSPEDKQEAIYTLSARGRYAQELTNALRENKIPKRDIPAHVARLLRRVVGNRFVDVWGPIDELGSDKEALLAKYRELLTESKLAKADLGNGQKVFTRVCASCHKLGGEGGKIGPDITGANRGNLEYLISNILTPSAIIQDDYRMHIILLEDGRIFSGIPTEENERSLKLNVADRTEPIVIAKSSIESREIASVSMMPDGLLSQLTDAEAVDLVRYLQSVPSK
ncbi:MAG: PVC-type heme-binding CxxCH protein [Pirellulales bacterium]